MVVLAQLRCSNARCTGPRDLLVGSLEEGWACATCGSPARQYKPKVTLATVEPLRVAAGPRPRRRSQRGRR